MIPRDKSGREIYPRIFNILKKHGNALVSAGWRESKNKPNLFWKKFSDVMVFADMRGTDTIPIWESPFPLLYAFSDQTEDWVKRRAIRHAIEDLRHIDVPYRFSFYDDCEPDGLWFGEDAKLADGSCQLCGKEMDNSGLFCSKECEDIFAQLGELRSEEDLCECKCSLCGIPLDIFGKNAIQHHVNYETEKTIWVCRRCHGKIHANHHKYPELDPNRPKGYVKRCVQEDDL